LPDAISKIIFKAYACLAAIQIKASPPPFRKRALPRFQLLIVCAPQSRTASKTGPDHHAVGWMMVA
jgi:hypothetical protein